jgi:hypothetical protein
MHALAPKTARAQEPTSDAVAQAQALFEEASRKLDRREFAAACPMLERALELAPTANGARLALAECYEGAGRRASAWRTYVETAEMAGRLGQPQRQEHAREKAEALRREVGLVIVTIDPSVRDLQTLSVTLAGQTLAANAWGTPLPMDGGRYALRATAAGKEPWERTVDVVDKSTVSITIDGLKDGQASSAQAPTRSLPERPTETYDPARELSHRGRFGAFARVHVDVAAPGQLTAVGLSYGIGERIEIGAAGLIGKRGGFEPDVSFFVLRGAFKPVAKLGVPVVFEGKAYAGVHVAGGLLWDIQGHVGVEATLGGSFFPNVPTGAAHAIFLPALGLLGRL